MKRIGLFLLTMVLFAAVSPIRAEVSSRPGSFRAVVAAELLRGDAAGAQFLKNLGQAPPAVPPELSSAAKSTWPVEARKYENHRIRVREAITRPVHPPEDQWRVDRAEADLQLVAYELNQNSRADQNLVRQYLADARWALDHHIAVSLMEPAAPAPDPPTAKIDADPNSIVEGSCATLIWHTTNATSATIDGVVVALNGSREVCPTASTRYVLVAKGPGGEVSDRTQITLTPRPLPPTADIDVEPKSIVEGTCATMTWRTTNATTAMIDGVDVALNGSRAVCPTASTGFLLVASGPGGETSDKTQITVTPRPPPPVPPTAEINVEPKSIVEGSCATLTWRTTNATTDKIDGVDATLNGSREVCPTASTGYMIVAKGPGGEASDKTQITVTPRPPPEPPTAKIDIAPNFIVEGTCAILSWHTTNTITNKIDGVDAALNGSREVCPTVSTGYMIVANGPGGEAQDRTNITVSPRPLPPTTDIDVEPKSVVEGSCATLTWHTTNATAAMIDGGNAALNGSRAVCPTASTGYMIVASGPGGEASAKTKITVTPRPPPPVPPTADIDVEPKSIVEGSCATLTWHTTNATTDKIDGVDAALNGSRAVCPTASTGYMIVASGPGGEASDKTQITVTPRPPPPVPPTAKIDISPNFIVEGSCATLTWHTTNATTSTIDGANAALNGSREVCPAASTGYMIVASGAGGEASDKTQITVTPRPARAFRIHFDFDEDVIRADAMDTMSKVARILREEPAVTFIVEGHTDWKGTNEYNKDLGMRRAEAVRDYFSVNFGIDPQRLRTISYGEERPLVPNAKPNGHDDPVGRQVNRRAVFVEEK